MSLGDASWVLVGKLQGVKGRLLLPVGRYLEKIKILQCWLSVEVHHRETKKIRAWLSGSDGVKMLPRFVLMRDMLIKLSLK